MCTTLRWILPVLFISACSDGPTTPLDPVVGDPAFDAADLKFTALGDTLPVVSTTSGTVSVNISSSNTAVVRILPDGRAVAVNNGLAELTVRTASRTERLEAAVRQRPMRVLLRSSAPLGDSIPVPTSTALGDTVRFSLAAFDRRDNPVPADLYSVRWRTDAPLFLALDSLSGVAVSRGNGNLRVWAELLQ